MGFRSPERTASERMRKQRDIRAFRKRKTKRPDSAPADMEHQTKKSADSSTNQHKHEESRLAGDSSLPDPARTAVSMSGMPLKAQTRETIRQLLGPVPLEHVRIHADPTAHEACTVLNATACAIGNHLLFSRGAYAPDTDEGLALLIHECIHSLQQTGGKHVPIPPETFAVDPSDQAEQEAQQLTEHAMQGNMSAGSSLTTTAVSIQRMQTGQQTTTYTNPTNDVRSNVDEITNRLSAIASELEHRKHDPASPQIAEARYTELAGQILGAGIPRRPVSIDVTGTQCDYTAWAEQYLAKRQLDESSWMPEDFPVDSSEDIEAREHLQRGFTAANGQWIQAGIQQSGPSCYPTATQTGLGLLGWNTHPYVPILNDFPETIAVDLDSLDQPLRERLQATRHMSNVDGQSQPSTIIDLLDDEFSVGDVIDTEHDPEIQNYGREVVNSILSTVPDGDIYTEKSPAVKGLTSSLMDTKKKQQREPNPAAHVEIEDKLRAGAALLGGMLDTSVHRKYGELSARRPDDGKHETIGNLKRQFMCLARHMRLPVIVNLPSVERNEETGTLSDTNPRHAVLLYGIERNRSGEIILRIRDPNDENGKSRRMPLTELLSYIDARAIKQRQTRQQRDDPVDDARDVISFDAIPLDDGQRNGLEPIQTTGWLSPHDVLDPNEQASATRADRRVQATAERNMAINKTKRHILQVRSIFQLGETRFQSGGMTTDSYLQLRSSYARNSTALVNQLAQLVVAGYLERHRQSV